jgi:hypothetical protein
VTPDDIRVVQGSWAALRDRRRLLVAELTRRFDCCSPAPVPSAQRAVWLLDAVAELVGLLTCASRLGDCARQLGQTWPDPLTAPSYRVEGRAWMGAAAATLPAAWSERTEAAWRQAWLLLSEVLAAETLSPFADCPSEGRSEEGALRTFTAPHPTSNEGLSQ